jgi:hypothetical protein
MDTILKTSLWKQFGAAIDTLEDAINLCPDHLWTAILWKDPDDPAYGSFWYLSAHTLMWLDLYLTGTMEGFAPPPPFKRGVIPETPYTKAQILGYLDQCRRNCKATIEALTDETANRVCPFDWMTPTFWELQIYCMRHVQEHAAQFNLFLGQHDITGMDWIAEAREIRQQ